ncbi:MAG: hypothetical protein ACP5TI_01240 [Thermoprotei archaeon]
MKIYVKGNWVREEEIMTAYQRISSPQKKILSTLLEVGRPSTISDLSAKTGIKRQYLSILMKKSLQHDLVRKFGRRNALYVLTEEGYKLLKPEVNPRSRSANHEALAATIRFHNIELLNLLSALV